MKEECRGFCNEHRSPTVKNNSKKSSRWSFSPIGIFKFAIIFVVVFWVAYPSLVWFLQGVSPVTEYSGLGEFGDMYGSLNTLFSGLAFSAVIATLALQREQLVTSQEELRLTRAEMVSQSSLFAAQTEVMNQQLFEGTFFQLVKLYLEKSSLLLESSNKLNERSPDKWNAIYRIFERGLNFNPKKELDYSEFDKAVQFSVVLSAKSAISLFLQTLKYIDDSTLISSDRKAFYVELLKGNTSNVEMYVIAIFVVYDEKFNKYQSYIEKYSLLDMLDTTYLLPINVFCDYKMAAYKSLRNEIFDVYVNLIVSSGIYNGLYSYDQNEKICDLKPLLMADYRYNYFGDYNCIIS
ncbi:MAG: putative phage abortive infection protein [Aeromonas sp.]|uniref:putative phage abortive infection protein n=1 Tax=Aeromonas sp. TaxID=647 RepID=UPI003F3D0819